MTKMTGESAVPLRRVDGRPHPRTQSVRPVDQRLSRKSDVESAVETRAQAGRLLDRLLHERRRSEQRFAEQGRPDTFKNVTGVSSLDRAIAATRDMIRSAETLIAELGPEPPLIETFLDPMPRSATIMGSAPIASAAAEVHTTRTSRAAAVAPMTASP